MVFAAAVEQISAALFAAVHYKRRARSLVQPVLLLRAVGGVETRTGPNGS